ncbi:MAG: segregation and condensation protein A [Oceanicoccus sp.]
MCPEWPRLVKLGTRNQGSLQTVKEELDKIERKDVSDLVDSKQPSVELPSNAEMFPAPLESSSDTIQQSSAELSSPSPLENRLSNPLESNFSGAGVEGSDTVESGTFVSGEATDLVDGIDPQEPASLGLQALRAIGAGQSEMPFAVVQGKAVTQLPQDLYIPPDALEVFLEAFEGPLDLLLYLIKRQNIDILDINVSRITHQYMQYVSMMDSMQFELAAEYLLMAAMLAEIKSRMLLPRSELMEEDEEDPRAQLIRRLQEYERFKKAAEDIDDVPRMGRDIFQAKAEPPVFDKIRPEPVVEMKEILMALGDVMRRADMFESHHIAKEKLSTRERMSQILDRLSDNHFTPFVSLFTIEEGRLGVVVTFLAVMELIKEALVEIVQAEAYGPIHVKARA